MNRFARAVVPVGLSVLGVGLVGLTATACSPASSAASAPVAATSAPAASPAPASSTPVPASSPPSSPAPVASARPTTASGPVPGAAPSAAPAPAGASGRAITYALFDCSGKTEVRPSSYVLTCADYGMVLSGMRWSAWQAGYARGAGTMQEKDCKPNCAEGKTIDYPVDATLTGSVRKSATTPYTYTKITLHYPGAAPAVYVTVNGKVTETHPSTFSMDLVNGPAR